MSNEIAITTKGNHITKVFGFVPEVVMPEFCRTAAVLAIACLGTWQPTGLDFMANGKSGFGFVGVFLSTAFIGFLAAGFAFFRLEPLLFTFPCHRLTFLFHRSSMRAIQIPLHGLFSFRRLCVSFSLGLGMIATCVAFASGTVAFPGLLTLCVYRFASLAFTVSAKFTVFVSVKLLKRLKVLAFRALFGKLSLRHVSIPFQLIRVRANLQHKLRLARVIPDHHTGFSITSNN